MYYGEFKISFTGEVARRLWTDYLAVQLLKVAASAFRATVTRIDPTDGGNSSEIAFGVQIDENWEPLYTKRAFMTKQIQTDVENNLLEALNREVDQEAGARVKENSYEIKTKGGGMTVFADSIGEAVVMAGERGMGFDIEAGEEVTIKRL